MKRVRKTMATTKKNDWVLELNLVAVGGRRRRLAELVAAAGHDGFVEAALQRRQRRRQARLLGAGVGLVGGLVVGGGGGGGARPSQHRVLAERRHERLDKVAARHHRLPFGHGLLGVLLSWKTQESLQSSVPEAFFRSRQTRERTELLEDAVGHLQRRLVLELFQDAHGRDVLQAVLQLLRDLETRVDDDDDEVGSLFIEIVDKKDRRTS